MQQAAARFPGSDVKRGVRREKGAFSHLDGYSFLMLKPDFRLHAEPDHERIVLGNEDRLVANEWAFHHLQEAKPARQSCEITHE